MLAKVLEFRMYSLVNRETDEKLWLRREAEAQEEFARKKLEEERRINQKEQQEVIISYYQPFHDSFYD
jgi:hypothetical protein